MRALVGQGEEAWGPRNTHLCFCPGDSEESQVGWGVPQQPTSRPSLSPSGPGDGEVHGCAGLPGMLGTAPRKRPRRLPRGRGGGSQQPQSQLLAADYPELLCADLTAWALPAQLTQHAQQRGTELRADLFPSWLGWTQFPGCDRVPFKPMVGTQARPFVLGPRSLN